MPLKPQYSWLSCASIQHASSSYTWISSVYGLKRQAEGHKSVFSCCHQRRSTTSHTSKRSRSQNEGLDPHWPTPRSDSVLPTPYEIFKQKKGTPYSKRRFYELVKIYHPDRNLHEDDRPGGISRATRLERYRLIIEANEILSDPMKRDAYDRWGAGWDKRPGTSPWGYAHQAERRWSGFNDNYSSAAGNATWEDWERWRHGQRSSREAQNPVYFSNGSFVVLIVLFAIVGGAAEIGRANHMSRSFLQQVEEKHDQTSKELMLRRRESQNLSSHEQRVQSFLRIRNPGAYGIGGQKGDTHEGLPPPEICASANSQTEISRPD